MMEVVAVMPSVPARLEERERTLAQLLALGFETLVQEPLPDEQPCPATHGRMAWRLLRAACRTYPGFPVLFVEDDVDLSSRLAERLPGIVALGEVVTLYLPGQQFYPVSVRRAIGSGLALADDLCPIVNQTQWFGSQALLLPVWAVRDLACQPPPTLGFDMVLREYLQLTGHRLYTTVPNLAQHRAPPSVTSPRYKPHRSVTYVG